jgi:hypothetical protein
MEYKTMKPSLKNYVDALSTTTDFHYSIATSKAIFCRIVNNMCILQSVGLGTSRQCGLDIREVADVDRKDLIQHKTVVHL